MRITKSYKELSSQNYDLPNKAVMRKTKKEVTYSIRIDGILEFQLWVPLQDGGYHSQQLWEKQLQGMSSLLRTNSLG